MVLFKWWPLFIYLGRDLKYSHPQHLCLFILSISCRVCDVSLSRMSGALLCHHWSSRANIKVNVDFLQSSRYILKENRGQSYVYSYDVLSYVVWRSCGERRYCLWSTLSPFWEFMCHTRKKATELRLWWLGMQLKMHESLLAGFVPYSVKTE
jgi:hypothetical protein